MSVFVLSMLLFQDPAQEPQRPVEKPRLQEKEVVIIGQRRESDVLDVPSGLTVITAEQISKTGATDIVQVLRTQPGFTAQGANAGAQDKLMDLRGYNNGAGNGQRTLVLVDGRKTNAVATSSTDWASIPVENIERIEIVRGPAASIYGDGALAGVVNIITKKGGKDYVSTAGASGGNWGTWRTSANVGGEMDKLHYDIFGGLEGTQGWRENSDYRGNNVTGRFEMPLNESLRGFIKLGHHDDDRERPGTITKAQIEQFGRDGSDKTGSDSQVTENYVDAGATQTLGTLGNLSAFVNFTRYASEAFFTDFGGFEAQDESDIGLLQLKHVVTSKLFGRDVVFTTGLDLSYETADAKSGAPGFIPDESTYRRRLLGLFEHVEVRPLDALILSASVRYDRALLDLDRDPGNSPFGTDSFDEDRSFDQINPSVGVTYKILEELSTYASWGRTFRYPTRDELVGFLTSDPQLKPERAATTEVGARYWQSGLGSASVTWFYMAVKDEVYFDPIAGTFGFGNNMNFEEVVHQGFETEARGNPVDWLELFATYTFTRVIITESDNNPAEEGKTYPVTPRHQATAGVSATAYGATLTLSSRYIGHRLLIRDFENLADPVENVVVYDAKLSYSWKMLTAFVSVFNVTDREYDDSAGFSSFGPVRFNPAPERSWLVGGEVRF